MLSVRIKFYFRDWGFSRLKSVWGVISIGVASIRSYQVMGVSSSKKHTHTQLSVSKHEQNAIVGKALQLLEQLASQHTHAQQLKQLASQ